MNADRAQLEKILFKLNSRLPAADTVCIALINGCAGPSIAANVYGLITRCTGPQLSPSLVALSVSARCTPR